jgi:rhodanese-related sulfurtransferase
LPGSSKLRRLTAAQLAEQQLLGTPLLDTRPAEEFASLHIRGAIQIGLMGNFSSWAAILIDPSRELLLVAENESSAAEASARLARVGIEHVIGYSLADELLWREHNLELDSISIHRCASVRQNLQSDTTPQLIDVRSRAEWLKGHLPGAVSAPLLDLNSSMPLIDLSKPSLVYCREGFRATTAASILLRESSGEIGIFIDGVEGWSAAGLPLEVPAAK